MVRYFFRLSYIGSRYRGAVKQIGCERLMDIDSIEGAVETALNTTLTPRSIIKPIFKISSRTDAGVHALNNSAQVDLEPSDGPIYSSELICRKLNAYFTRCGHEIRIISAVPVTEEFDTRRNALSRTYFYRLAVAKNCHDFQIPVAELGRAWHIRGENLDIDVMKRGTQIFMGTKNFATFAAKNRTNRSIKYVRTLKNFSIEPAVGLMPDDPISQNYDYWNVVITAKGFLYNQVRRLVGALVALSTGLITERDIRIMLHVPAYFNWHNEICVAPPQGLYLKNVEYDPEHLASCLISANSEQEQVKKFESITTLDRYLASKMDFQSEIAQKKKKLKATKTVLTTEVGKKFEIFQGKSTQLPEGGLPFVVDTQPDLQVACIIPGLYLSSQDPVSCRELLEEHEIKHILSLGIEPFVKFDGIKYYSVDILDLPEFNLRTACDACFEIIEQNRARGENTLVHCNAGVSRSPTIVISYLMALEKLSYDEAYERVRVVRSVIRPNDGFILQLKNSVKLEQRNG